MKGALTIFKNKLYRVRIEKGKLYSKFTGYPMNKLIIEWWNIN